MFGHLLICVKSLQGTWNHKLDSQHLRGQVATYWWQVGVIRGKGVGHFLLLRPAK